MALSYCVICFVLSSSLALQISSFIPFNSSWIPQWPLPAFFLYPVRWQWQIDGVDCFRTTLQYTKACHREEGGRGQQREGRDHSKDVKYNRERRVVKWCRWQAVGCLYRRKHDRSCTYRACSLLWSSGSVAVFYLPWYLLPHQLVLGSPHQYDCLHFNILWQFSAAMYMDVI
jgi:hypothetical protein